MRFDVHPFKTLEEALEWARAQIDASAGQARARYITIAAGQDATYQAKYADALAFVRAGYPEDQVDQYPWIKAEASGTNVSPREAADSIKSVGDPWHSVIGPRIEGLRIGGKKNLESLASIGEVVVHTRSVQAMLNTV